MRSRVGVITVLVGLVLVACGTAEDDAGPPTESTTSAEPTTPASEAEPPTANSEGCVAAYDEAVDYFPDKVVADHARGWSVEYFPAFKVVRTSVFGAGAHAGAGGRGLGGTYVLVQCGTPTPELTGDLTDATMIEVPVESFVDGGSIFYAAADRLDIAESLVGEAEPFVTDVEKPYLPRIAEHIEAQGIREVGYEANLEVIAELSPGFYTNYAGDDAMFAGIEQLDVPVVFFFPYSETPLGAAEHVEFLSLFFNREARANEIADGVEERFEVVQDEVLAHANDLNEPVSVLVGVFGDDGMTTRQRERFEPELIEAAGAVAIPDLPGGGIEVVPIERALEEGAKADYFLDLVFFPSATTADEYLENDPRLDPLPAVAEGRIFTRVGPRGADYFLSGAVDVEKTLKDLAAIIYPELYPNHKVEFFGVIPPE